MTDTTIGVPPAVDLDPQSLLVDITAITARVGAVPAGDWEAFPGALRVPYAGDGDLEPVDGMPWLSGRFLAVQENEWHDGTDLPGEVLEFLAHAADDVRALLRLVHWYGSAYSAAVAASEGAGR
jgi:hypothetical protein